MHHTTSFADLSDSYKVMQYNGKEYFTGIPSPEYYGRSYTMLILDELSSTANDGVKDPKLQKVLERQYALAMCKHDKKLMKRIEKQMEANHC